KTAELPKENATIQRVGVNEWELKLPMSTLEGMSALLPSAPVPQTAVQIPATPLPAMERADIAPPSASSEAAPAPYADASPANVFVARPVQAVEIPAPAAPAVAEIAPASAFEQSATADEPAPRRDAPVEAQTPIADVAPVPPSVVIASIPSA